MKQAAQTARASVGGIKAKCAPLVRENHVDLEILNKVIPEIEDRLLQAEDYFSDAAYILQYNATDFSGRRSFRAGCTATARAALKLGVARIKSLDANIFEPHAIEFSDIEFDIEEARADALCG
jgi:hypothetical protein